MIQVRIPLAVPTLQLAPILFGVVVVFVVCNSLRVVLNIYDFRDDELINC